MTTSSSKKNADLKLLPEVAAKHEENAFDILGKYDNNAMETYLRDIETAQINIKNNPQIGKNTPTGAYPNLRTHISKNKWSLCYDTDETEKEIKLTIISIGFGLAPQN